jgi:hypothetical protein
MTKASLSSLIKTNTMKYFSVLVFTVLTSSCWVTTAVVNDKTESTREITMAKKGPDMSGATLQYFDHSIWQELLENNVSVNGNVDYKGFKNNTKTLKIYIESLSNIMPTSDCPKNDILA